jgi:hypothetical protein
MISPLKNFKFNIPSIGAPGDFGYKRSFYYHPGIDLYCDFGQEVQAIESGTIVNMENFTGANANPPSPWWNETQSILIEGQSGVIGYCELKPTSNLKIGNLVNIGDLLGTIIPVLKRDKKFGTTMLHIELYKANTTNHVTWLIDNDKPENLLNPRQLLELIPNAEN